MHAAFERGPQFQRVPTLLPPSPHLFDWLCCLDRDRRILCGFFTPNTIRGENECIILLRIEMDSFGCLKRQRPPVHRPRLSPTRRIDRAECVQRLLLCRNKPQLAFDLQLMDSIVADSTLYYAREGLGDPEERRRRFGRAKLHRR